MMEPKLVGQLKSLKTHRAGGSPDERWLASTRETLLMQIRNTVSEEPRKAGFKAFAESVRLFWSPNLSRTMAVPLAVLVLTLGAGLSASGITAISRDALPGGALYEAKLLAEQVSVRFTGRGARTEKRVEVAGRRLDEMARLAASADPKKEEKIARVSSLFSKEMSAIRKDLIALQQEEDVEAAVRVALAVDAKADEYQKLFKQGMFLGRPSFRLALLSLDQAAVSALEILVEKHSAVSDVLPEARLGAAVGKKIESFASRVAVTEGSLIAENDDASGLLLTARAKAAVEEAKSLLEQGDFRAAVRKVGEGAALVSEAESAGPGAGPVDSASGTDAASQSATSSPEEAPKQE